MKDDDDGRTLLVGLNEHITVIAAADEYLCFVTRDFTSFVHPNMAKALRNFLVSHYGPSGEPRDPSKSPSPGRHPIGGESP